MSDDQTYNVDAIAPTVTSVNCTASNATHGLTGANVTDCANGSYNENDVLSISVGFDEAVNVASANPQLTLAMDGANETVNYNSGTGSTTLVFPFTIDDDDNTSDLDYAATSSLALNSATIRDGHGNNATLTLPSPGGSGSLGANKALIVDTTAPTLHGTAADKVTTATANGSYKAGEVIDITAKFTETVYTSGTPQLTLALTDAAGNGANRAIDMSAGGGGTGSEILTFRFTVAAGENSSDLDYAANSSLSAGTYIRDLAGNNATRTLSNPGASGSLGSNKAIIIDTVAPTVDTDNGGLDAATDGTYYIDDVVVISVLFTEVVLAPTSDPTLTLETGGTDAVVNYTTGSGNANKKLVFNYTVAAPHTSADLDHQSTTALTGTITDVAGNAANVTLPALTAAGSLSANAAVVVDGVRPTVTNVTSTTADGSYNHVDDGGGDNVIPITVTFDEAVWVSGSPTIALETGDTDASVSYTSGSGGTTLTFDYTVSTGHNSDDLEYTATDALAAAGGAWIRDANTTDANTATLTLPGMGNAGSLGANKALIIDTTAPTVDNVTSATDNGSYNHVDDGGGDNVIPVTITFTEAVTVVGTPKLTLETGGTDTDVDYAAGTGTTDLVFNYTIGAGNTSADLDYTAVGALTAGTSIRDAAKNDATRTLAAPGQAGSLGANKALIIDTTAPTVNSVSSTLANGTYNLNQLVPIQVEFSEDVIVTGTPLLELETGDADANASYNAGSGGDELTFNYTVVTGNESADLDYKATTSLGAGTSIRDAAKNDATRTLASPGQAGSLGANKALVIDAELITVNSVSSTKADGSYKAGVEIDVTITLSEIANVNTTGGTPRITLETGDTDAVVDYTGGTGSNTLTFRYTVADGHTSADLDYQSTAALVLNNGTIKDPTTGTDATLTLPDLAGPNSISGQKALIIDTTPPTVDFVSSTTADGHYNATTVIPLVIDFSEDVAVTGSPTITLETGDTDATVSYTSGSLNDTLIFNYTVAAGENSADLDYGATSSLVLNGGVIADIAGNNATLTLAAPAAANSLAFNKNLVIDTIKPTVEFVTSTTPNGTSKLGDVIPILIDFSENIYVTGTPKLTLETGAANTAVNYTSGSENDTLVFNYAVAAGNSSNDLDYVATTSLNDGTSMKDLAGNDIDTTLAVPGAANSLGANKALVVDGIVPTVDSVSTTTVDGYYNAGDTIQVVLYVNESLAVTGTPKLLLETGTSDASAPYTSNTTGTGRQTVYFQYIVSAGHNNADLDYTDTTSLSLDGGSIKDVAGNVMNLTLPVPGQAGSIAFKRAVVVDTEPPTAALTYVNDTQVALENLGKGEDQLSVSAKFNESILSTPSFLLFWPTTVDTLNTAFTGSANNDSEWTYTIASLPTENSYTGNLKFRIIATDLAGNPVSVVTDTTAFYLDTTPPAAFTTGDIVPEGSYPKLRWFNRRTDSLDVEFPIQNSDLTLTRGKAQAYMKIIGIGGSDVALGSAKILTNTSLPVQSINFTKAQVRGAIGANFVQDARIATWIDLYDKANNLTSGAVSLDTLTIDTIPPVKGSFLSGNVIAGETLVSSDSINATVTGFTDAHSGMDSYEWGVGQYREARYVELDSIKEWTPIPNEKISGVAPLRDATYHRLSVRGLDNAGNLSDTLGTSPGFLRLNSTPIIVDAGEVQIKEEVDLSYFVEATDVDANTLLSDTLSYYFYDTATATKDTLDSLVLKTGSPAIKINKSSGEISWATPYHGSTTDYVIPIKVVDNTNRDTTSTFPLKVKLNEKPRYNQIAYIRVTGDSVVSPVPTKVEDLWENDTLIVEFTLDDLDDDTLTYNITTDSTKLRVITADSIITSTSDTVKVTFIPEKFWTKSSNVKLSVSDGFVNGANRIIDTTFVMDIKRVPRPHYKLSLGQNPSFTRYYELMVTDTTEKAKNLDLYIYRDGTIPVGAVEMKSLGLYTWVGNFEFDTTANYQFEMKGDGLVGDTTVYDTASHALARANRPWKASSYDGGFSVISKSTNAVAFDKPFMIVDSLLFDPGEAEGGLYRMGHPLVEFEKPVMVTINPDDRFDEEKQAIHQMVGGVWEELPTVSKNGKIMAWTKSMGYFKIGDKTIEVPEETLLGNNYPNPFNSSTNIEFDIGFFGGPEQRVFVSVYNILGQRVKTLHEGIISIGRHSMRWNGRDMNESPVSSGIYVLRLISDSGISQSKKMTLVR